MMYTFCLNPRFGLQRLEHANGQKFQIDREGRSHTWLCGLTKEKGAKDWHCREIGL